MTIPYESLDFKKNIFPSIDLYSFHYDSPIEKILGESLAKYDIMSSAIKIIPQVSIKTSGGVFILDFLIIANGNKYAIECDGKEFHEYYHDLYRDGMLICEGFITDMIRFRGQDLTIFPQACTLFLGKNISGLLSSTQLEAVEMAARSERWDFQIRQDPEGKHFYDEIFQDDVTDIQGEYTCRNIPIRIICRNNRVKPFETPHQAPDWLNAYLFAKKNNITNWEEFVQTYRYNDIGRRKYYQKIDLEDFEDFDF